MTGPAAGTPEERLARAVADLHALFEEWFTGRAPEAAFGRLEAALAEGFEIVTPDGARLGRRALLDGLRAARGRRADDPGGFRIRVADVRARPAGPRAAGPRARAGGLWIVGYEEWQRADGLERGRRSSALLELAEPPPAAAVLWHHVHETWLPRRPAHPGGPP